MDDGPFCPRLVWLWFVFGRMVVFFILLLIFLGCRFESRRGLSFFYVRLYAFSFRARGQFCLVYQCFLLVFYFIGMILMMVYYFSLSSLTSLGGWSTACARAPRWGQGLARSEPRPALHARSLDVRDAQRSSTASRGWRLFGGVLELSSRWVKGVLV